MYTKNGFVALKNSKQASINLLMVTGARDGRPENSLRPLVSGFLFSIFHPCNLSAKGYNLLAKN